MAVMKRGGDWYIYFRPFKDKKIGLKLDTTSKAEAKGIEAMLTRACRTGNYSGLDEDDGEACIRMFINQKWELPAELEGTVFEAPKEELTLWRATELTLKYPEVRNSANRARHEQAFVHLVEHFGKDFPAKSLWIPHVKQYQIERTNQGAAASTINKERAALSKMFQVLIELGHHDRNPVRMVKGPSERDGRREVYISFEDFSVTLTNLPAWVKPIVQTLFFTGMRRGEALGLTWENVNLESRIIRLHAHQTKERQPKRVPIHRLLVPAIQAAGKVRSISSDRVFLMDTGKPPCEHSIRKPWVQAVTAIGLDPAPTIHDLRHCWKTNAMRSGVDFEIREAIMGHCRGIAGGTAV